MDEDFIANFEDEYGWTPDCAYDIIGEENIGGESMKLSKLRKIMKGSENFRYTLYDCVNIVKQVKGVYYPPSGKYYEFSDGSTCEDWNLEFHIKDKLAGFQKGEKE